MYRSILLVLSCVTLLVAASRLIAAESAPGLILYVAANGNDAWSGKMAEPNAGDGPFLTLQGARDAIRKLKQAGGLPPGGAVVEILGGVYQLDAPFSLAAEDSGTEASPILYRGRQGEEVRLLGGRVVGQWTPVRDPAVRERLDESARDHVVQADLRAQNITDLGQMQPGPTWGQSEAGLELFFQRKPMTLARWPNEGFVTIPKVLGATPDPDRKNCCREGFFAYEGDRPRRWLGQPDIMLEGYWGLDWADQRLKVAAIDPEKRTITLEPKPEHAYGFREGQWYYAYNLLSEIDQPGEWYLDRSSGILYFWPPAPVEQGEAMISVLPTVIQMKDVSHVAIRRLTVEVCRRTAITAANVSHVEIAGCTIRNTGGFAVSLSGGQSRVAGCDIYDNGDGGIVLAGGDRKTLTPGKLVADNNHIHHYGRVNRVYKAGVSLNGVGNVATHNLIENAPHQAMNFSGNDHRIEFNEIHSVCYESNDAGAIYCGRNWTMRGTVVCHNYFHDISGYRGKGCVGVYLDDQFSGTEISGNLFVRVTRAAMIGGGRDCTIANNVFVDCTPAVHVDARGLTWPASANHSGLFDCMKKSLDEVPYQDSLWAARYPKLPKMLEENPMAPRGNLIARNVSVGGRWSDIDGPSKVLVTLEDNLLDADPRFVDAAQGNYQLQEDSPAWKLGFQRLPLEQMGLYESPDRASWPVSHTVRPAEVPAKK